MQKKKKDSVLYFIMEKLLSIFPWANNQKKRDELLPPSQCCRFLLLSRGAFLFVCLFVFFLCFFFTIKQLFCLIFT